jgi:methionyl-tRNA synthetase
VNGHFDDYIAETLEIITELNRYWSLVEPWNIKNPEKLQTILYISFEGIRIVSVLLQPIMPTKCKILLDWLGIPVDCRSLDSAVYGCAISDRKIDPMKPLFPKIDEFK